MQRMQLLGIDSFDGDRHEASLHFTTRFKRSDADRLVASSPNF